jgi:hypothetical protein
MDDQRAETDVERVRAEHYLLRAMDPFDRTVALLSAIVDAERGDAYRQVASLVAVLETMGGLLGQDEREAIAAEMADACVRLVCRWH